MKKPIEEWLVKSNFFSFKTHNIFYNQFGEGEDLIIIHGYPYSSYEWKEIVPLLSKRFKVTVFDLLGFGFSDKPENHIYSFEEYTDLLNKLTLHLKIEQAHIIAHDLGVSLAQELLAFENDYNLNFSIKSVCFTNGNLFPDVYKARLIQKLISQTPTFIGKFLSKKISKKTVHKNIRNLYGKYTQPSEEFMEELWEILNYKDGKNISYLLGRLVFEKIKYHFPNKTKFVTLDTDFKSSIRRQWCLEGKNIYKKEEKKFPLLFLYKFNFILQDFQIDQE
jgi:hypothetical protein